MESPYNDVDIQCIEQEIMKLNASQASIDKEQVKTLLRLRKSMLDHRARALGTISSQGSTRAPLGGGERVSSLSNPPTPRKGVFEKK